MYWTDSLVCSKKKVSTSSLTKVNIVVKSALIVLLRDLYFCAFPPLSFNTMTGVFYSLIKGGGSHSGQWCQRVQPRVSRAPLQSIVNRGQDLRQHSAGICCFKTLCDLFHLCWILFRPDMIWISVNVAGGGLGPGLLASVQPNLQLRNRHCRDSICHRPQWWVRTCVCVCVCVWVWFKQSRDGRAIIIADMMGGEVCPREGTTRISELIILARRKA